jgi:hypothetical protein
LATAYKVLGQSAPANTANATLYTVPSATSAVVSTIAIANVTAISATARVFVVKSGGSAAASNALVYDAVFGANSTTTFTIGITLATGDALLVQTGTANAITFQAFGSELS